MDENLIKMGLLYDLKIQKIQPFQIEDELRLKGLASFDVERLKKEISAEYEKMHLCM